MASFIYTSFVTKLLNGGGISLAGDTIKAAILGAGYTPAKTHSTYADISGQEVTGTGYVAGGAALTNKTVTQDNTNFDAVFDADDPSWANSTITGRYVALYKDTGTPSTSYLIALIDLGQSLSSSASTFSVVFNASGVLILAIV